ncbi:transglycosylase domain-containing protein [Acidobacteriota bacterium]
MDWMHDYLNKRNAGGALKRLTIVLDTVKDHANELNCKMNLRKWLISTSGILIALGLIFAVTTGITLGYVLVKSDDLPEISVLEDHRPSIITRIHDRDGKTIGLFATEKRIIVTHDQIPEHLRQAIVAVEDSRFYKHRGIDQIGILRATWKNIKAKRLVQGGRF